MFATGMMALVSGLRIQPRLRAFVRLISSARGFDSTDRVHEDRPIATPERHEVIRKAKAIRTMS